MDNYKVEITLSAEVMHFANGLIDGQRYATLSDVVEAALARFDREAEAETLHTAWLRREVQKGLDDVARGDTYDEETVFNEIDVILGRKSEPVG